VALVALAAAATARPSAAQPCYGSLGATQTERQAAAADRNRARYAYRDRRYAGVDAGSIRMRMRQRGCDDRDKARSFGCQRLRGQLSAARRNTHAQGRRGLALDRSARYHDRRARAFANDYHRCGGRLRP
jgi:hypothetical protein